MQRRADGPANGLALVYVSGSSPSRFVIQYFGRPLSLALRLWGNLFAGGLMVMVIAQLPAYLLWLPTAAWKLFDLFIGLLQALIFTMLTVIYFSEAVAES